MDALKKLMAARCRLIAVQPFYGHFCMTMKWTESKMDFMPEGSRTMGVRVAGGRVECIWCREFVDGRSLEELIACLQHEVEHLLRMHCVRAGDRNPFLWNIAVDMTVNGRADSPRIGYHDTSNVILPLGPDSKDKMVWIPADWPSNETAEHYYDKIMQKNDKFAQEIFKLMQEAEKNGGKVPDGMVDNHAFWSKTEMTPDEIRQIVHDVAQQSVEKSKGNVPGHVAALLEKLADPIVGWRQLLRQYLGRHLGDRRSTYSRRCRRNDRFGTKGISHHAAARACVIVDTSGSISESELSQFFAEIEAIAYRVRVCMVEWDAQLQAFHPRYRRGDWKHIQIKGRGGTAMDDAVDWVEENGVAGDVCIMLTDGYTGWPNKKPFPMINCITTDADGPSWGHVVRLQEMKSYLCKT